MEHIQLTSYSKMRVDLAAQVGCNVHAFIYILYIYILLYGLHLGIEQHYS